MPHPFFLYTETVLAFAIGPDDRSGETGAPPALPERDAARFRDRVLRAITSGQARHVVLFGLGSGRAARELAKALPPEASLTVVCLDPALARGAARAGGLSWLGPDGRAQLLCDASPWAVWLLARLAGIGPGKSLDVFSPESLDPREKARLLALKRLFSRAGEIRVPPQGREPGPGDAPRISFAAVLSPEEPDLEGFFAAVPPGMFEVVAVWDAPEVPGAARAGALSPVPVRHLARPLGRDFAAQRNAMLGACGGDWVFFLDADERPGPEMAAMPPFLASLAGMEGIGAFAFPRLTLYPDAARAKVGYGLWPDLQTRLVRRVNPDGTSPWFERPVHERLAGLAGEVAVVPGVNIMHLSRLLKDRETLAAKLQGFDAASAGGVSHRVNREYPSLPLAFFSTHSARDPFSVLVLPGGRANRAAPVDLRAGTG